LGWHRWVHRLLPREERSTARQGPPRNMVAQIELCSLGKFGTQRSPICNNHDVSMDWQSVLFWQKTIDSCTTHNRLHYFSYNHHNNPSCLIAPLHGFFTASNVLWLIIIFFTLDASFSITLFASRFVAWVLGRSPPLSVFGIAFLILFREF
jgi:hypothetical protein